MQNVQFRSLNDFYDFLPQKELELVEYLMGVVKECLPQYKEKLSYNVPYYSNHKRICFIWPSSIKWGNVKSDGVMLGFCQGNLLEDAINFLEKGKRKQVYTKTYTHLDQINEEEVLLLKSYLEDAWAVDKNFEK